MGTTERFSLDVLATLADTPARTIRYYIERGLIPRPHGARRTAWYGPVHLERLVTIRKWRDGGMSLDRIAELLAGESDAPPARRAKPGAVEVRSHLVIDDGIELSVEPTRAEMSPEEVRALFRAVTAAYRDIRNARGAK